MENEPHVDLLGMERNPTCLLVSPDATTQDYIRAISDQNLSVHPLAKGDGQTWEESIFQYSQKYAPDVIVFDTAKVESPFDMIQTLRNNDKLVKIVGIFSRKGNLKNTWDALQSFKNKYSILHDIHNIDPIISKAMKNWVPEIKEDEETHFYKYYMNAKSLLEIQKGEHIIGEKALKKLEDEVRKNTFYAERKITSSHLFMGTGTGLACSINFDLPASGQPLFGVKNIPTSEVMNLLQILNTGKEKGIPMGEILAGPYKINENETVISYQIEPSVRIDLLFPIIDSFLKNPNNSDIHKEAASKYQDTIIRYNLSTVAAYQHIMKRFVDPDHKFEEGKIEDLLSEANQKNAIQNKSFDKEEKKRILEVYKKETIESLCKGSRDDNGNYEPILNATKIGRIEEAWSNLISYLLGECNGNTKEISGLWFAKKLDNVPKNSGQTGFGKFKIDELDLKKFLDNYIENENINESALEKAVDQNKRMWDPSFKWALIEEDFFMFFESAGMNISDSKKVEYFEEFMTEKYNVFTGENTIYKKEKFEENMNEHFPLFFLLGYFRNIRARSLLIKKYMQQSEEEYKHRGITKEDYTKLDKCYLEDCLEHSKNAAKYLYYGTVFVSRAMGDFAENIKRTKSIISEYEQTGTIKPVPENNTSIDYNMIIKFQKIFRELEESKDLIGYDSKRLEKF